MSNGIGDLDAGRGTGNLRVPHLLLALVFPLVASLAFFTGSGERQVFLLLVALGGAIAAWSLGGPFAWLFLVLPFGGKIHLSFGNLYFGTVLVLVFLTIWLATILAKRGAARLLPRSVTWSGAALVSVLALSALLVLPDLVGRKVELYRLVQLVAYLLLFPAAYDLAPAGPRLRFLVLSPLLVAMAQAAYALALSPVGPRGFLVGTFDSEHSSFAAEMVLALLLVLGLLVMVRTRWVRVMLLAGAALSGTALLLSQSRSGLVAVLVGVLVLGALPLPRPWRAILGLSLVVAVIAGALLLPAGGRERLIGTVTHADSAGDVAVGRRVLMWAEAMRAFRAHPIFGGGIGSQGLTDGYFVRMAAELGMVGLIVFGWYVVSVLGVAHRLARGACRSVVPGARGAACGLARAVAPGFWAAAVALLLVMNLTLDFFLVHRVMGSFWLMAGLLLRLHEEEAT